MNIPHNIEAERALLHQLIFERGQNISQVLAMGIDSGCFHHPLDTLPRISNLSSSPLRL